MRQFSRRSGVALMGETVEVLALSQDSVDQPKSPLKTGEDLASRRPNVIVMTWDDLEAGARGYHGSALNMPNLDRMARERLSASHGLLHKQ
jgi:hypothetical protein